MEARFLPPKLPSWAAALGEPAVSSISPVAIFPIITARPMASAGRFSPRGPLGMWNYPGFDKDFEGAARHHEFAIRSGIGN
ncbi:MAG: hypothetical protein ABL918_12570 [Chakrabartia sp.]